MNLGDWVQIAANIAVVAGGVGPATRSLWRAARAFDHIAARVEDHEERLRLLEGRGRRREVGRR
ncbi:hypothetical protein [Amycolatopsis alkalitolerans]|uniref:Uncharacterized protein n=1 Tax=Amycolatopsis alkalitolerans TaxID=2547244 RepID=A0A5C4LPA0_9PSEU|nr:hypothetical protein [Amycolatopsis alkalitolerans]TNC19075.1 hypothetical protein FG385_32940 [Amycolatopsis alkalitolerans]